MVFAHWGILEGMFYSLRLSPQQLSHLPSSGLSAWTAKPGVGVELQSRLCSLLFLTSFLLAFPKALIFLFLCYKRGKNKRMSSKYVKH